MAVTDIFRDGVLVDVNVSLWSGSKILRPEDLGLEEKDVAEAYRLGRKMLVPAEVIREFRHIEGRARRVVEENSFRFPVGNARFVPKKKFGFVQETLQGYQSVFKGLSDKLVENYEEYRQKMLPVYRQAAEVAFINQTPETQTFGPDYDREKEKQDYISAFLARIGTYYPPPESLRSKFSLSWDVYELALPGEDQHNADEYRTRMRERIGGFVEDVVKALRQETVEICGRVAKNISEGKVIRERTLQSLKNFVDKFQALNFVGDVQIEARLGELRKDILDAYPSSQFSDDSDLQEQLKRKLGQLSEAAADMTDINSVTGQYNRKISWQEGQ